MKLEITLSEANELINQIKEGGINFFDIIRTNINESIGSYLSNLMDVELSSCLNREKYERCTSDKNYRNGSYNRKFILKGIGNVSVQVPRDRNNEYQTGIIPNSKRYEDKIGQDLSLMYLGGVSTRTLSLMSERLIGRRLSHTEISSCSSELKESVEKWRNRSLSDESIKYMYLDGVYFKMRVGRHIENVPVLVAIGVRENRTKTVLSMQIGDKESSSTWREFFRDLKCRGLDKNHVKLGVMDGLPGLEKVFKEEFSNSKIQRCQVHVSRNVLCKVPKGIKQEVADDIRSIFYSSDRKKAFEFYEQFIDKWEKKVPSAVRSLSNSIDSCLTFFNFPNEEWISLRTTNVIERLNKEFKRRTKTMEILAGESSCYVLMAFIALKMEITWKSSPIGSKAAKNLYYLPLFEKG